MFRTSRRLATLLIPGVLMALPFVPASLHAARAAPQQEDSTALKKGEKVDITSNNMEVFEKDNRVIFSGNVKAVKGDTTLYADRMEVIIEKVKQQDGTEKDKVSKIYATGHVRIVKPNMTITGRKAFMDVKKDIATVEGNVVVKRSKSVIRGQKLIANLKTNVTRVVSGGRQRVHGVFQR